MNLAPPPALPATLSRPQRGSAERPFAVYWRPNEAFLDDFAHALCGKKVLEIFAGNGYLAAELSARGVDITATSFLTSMDAHERGLYHPVVPMGAEQAAHAFKDTHDILLMCWPTVTDAALKACQAFGDGRPIAYIGEATDYSKGHLGGCATDEFFEAFAAQKHFPSYQGNMLEIACIGAIGTPQPMALPLAKKRLKSF